MTGRRIAARLALSVKTIETHRARLTDKLGRHNRADLVRLALNIGLPQALGVTLAGVGASPRSLSR